MSETTTIRIVHADAALLAETGRGVVGTWKAIATGDWAALVELCAHPNAGEKILNPAEAVIILDEAAALSGYDFPSVGELKPLTETLTLPNEGDSDNGDGGTPVYEMTGDLGAAIGALDLFMRLLCGQWDEIGWVCSIASAQKSGGADNVAAWDRYSLNMLRGRLCHTRDHQLGTRGPRETYRPLAQHEFPSHPSASISIAQAVEPARLAYWAYKLLGAGAPGGPTFTPRNGHAPIVTVDGVEKALVGY